MLGRTIAHYQITEKLGSGGMGDVYLATDTKLDRPVALKFLPESLARDPEARSRLVREAQSASRLNHSNILTIHAIEQHEGRDFIVMEYLQGKPLDLYLSDQTSSLAQRLDLAIQIADGLAAAHDAGIIHRDLKPANILVDSAGRATILDFGIARCRESKPLTQEGALVGTVAYMSPEQIQGLAVDLRSDVFSFGILLYEMLTDQRPFAGDHDAALLYAIVHESPEPLLKHRSDLPPRLQPILDQCLDKNPDRRYESASALLRDLKVLLRQVEIGSRSAVGLSVPEVASIAVLPLADISPEKDQEYFCDGLAEELINTLTRLPALRVVARTSAFAFKEQNIDIRTIGQRLGVQNVLEGSVRKAGNRLRITVQLVNVHDGYPIWSERYDRNLEDVFAIQEEIARSVAESLRVRLKTGAPTAPEPRPTRNVEAYNLYLEGRFHWNKRTPAAFRKALDCFRRAIGHDPQFALAYAGLADTHMMFEDFGVVAGTDGWTLSRQAATQALALDDRLAEAHTSMAMVLSENHQWDQAEQEYQRAIELNPGYATGHHWYAMYLMDMARLEEAFVEISRARELDPLSLPIHVDLGRFYYYSCRFEESIDHLKKTLDWDPGFARAHRLLFLVYQQLNMEREAVRTIPGWLPHFVSTNLDGFRWDDIYASSDFTGVLRELLKILIDNSSGYALAYAIAAIHARLNDESEALDWLERACLTRFPNLVGLRLDPALDKIRPEPRFQSLLQRMGVML